MADQPIICSLTPEALEVRKRGLLARLLDRSAGRELLADGLRLRFEPSSETLSSILRAVEAERHCCRFLRFTITVEPNDGPTILDLTGPRGTREFLAALLELSASTSRCLRSPHFSRSPVVSRFGSGFVGEQHRLLSCSASSA